MVDGGHGEGAFFPRHSVLLGTFVLIYHEGLRRGVTVEFRTIFWAQRTCFLPLLQTMAHETAAFNYATASPDRQVTDQAYSLLAIFVLLIPLSFFHPEFPSGNGPPFLAHSLLASFRHRNTGKKAINDY